MPKGDDEDEDSLPVKLPPGPVAKPRFSPARIDYSINKQLQGLIPSDAGAVVVTARFTSGEESKIITGIGAVKINERWGMVLAGSLDLDHRKNWTVEILAVRS